MKNFFIPEPVIFAYMGGVPDLPPGSPEAFRKAAELGVHAFCVDAWLSRDGRVVIASTDRLDAISNGSGRISDSSLDEVRALDAGYSFQLNGSFPCRGKGFTFCTLDEILALFPVMRFVVRIMENATACAEAVLAAVRGASAADRVLLASYHQGPMNLVRKKCPAMATAMTMREIMFIYALFKTGLLGLKRRFRGDALQIPEMLGTSYVANAGLIHALRKRGIRVHVLDVTGKKQLARVMESGAGGFIMPDITIYGKAGGE